MDDLGDKGEEDSTNDTKSVRFGIPAINANKPKKSIFYIFLAVKPTIR